MTEMTRVSLNEMTSRAGFIGILHDHVDGVAAVDERLVVRGKKDARPCRVAYRILSVQNQARDIILVIRII